MQTITPGNFDIETAEHLFTYLMRDDSYETIRGFARRAEDEGNTFDDDMIDRLTKKYQTFIHGLTNAYIDSSGSRHTNVHIVEAQTVNRARNEKIREYVNGHDDSYIVVTMDPLCDYPGAIPFAVSRLFDPDGLVSENLTNRPGHDTIAHQIHTIHQASQGKKVILVEDDLFSGSTIQRTMGLFQSNFLNGSDGSHIDVVALFPGIQAISTTGMVLTSHLHIDPVYRVHIPIGSETEYVLDIGDPRDFLLGGDGLVTTKGRMPYIRPFVSPHARASVPSHLEESFSSIVLDLTHDFYKDAEKITGTIWPVTLCEPAAQEGLSFHGLANPNERSTKSMVDVLNDAIRYHQKQWVPSIQFA